MAQRKQSQLGTVRLQVPSLDSLSGLRIQRCRELWCRSQMRLGSDLALLWLWCRSATAALIQRLASEPPYAVWP